MQGSLFINLYADMDSQKVLFEDLGTMDYQAAWDYQESLLQENLKINGYRSVTLIEEIVASPQFRQQRCRDFSLADFRQSNSASSNPASGAKP